MNNEELTSEAQRLCVNFFNSLIRNIELEVIDPVNIVELKKQLHLASECNYRKKTLKNGQIVKEFDSLLNGQTIEEFESYENHLFNMLSIVPIASEFSLECDFKLYPKSKKLKYITQYIIIQLIERYGEFNNVKLMEDTCKELLATISYNYFNVNLNLEYEFKTNKVVINPISTEKMSEANVREDLIKITSIYHALQNYDFKQFKKLVQDIKDDAINNRKKVKEKFIENL